MKGLQPSFQRSSSMIRVVSNRVTLKNEWCVQSLKHMPKEQNATSSCVTSRQQYQISRRPFSKIVISLKRWCNRLRMMPEWDVKLRQLYFMKGLTLIEEGYCNDALNLVSQINSEDVKFIYLKQVMIPGLKHYYQSFGLHQSWKQATCLCRDRHLFGARPFQR